jgi:hypothetical protein
LADKPSAIKEILDTIKVVEEMDVNQLADQVF